MTEWMRFVSQQIGLREVTSKGGVDWIVQERTQAIGHLTCATLVVFPGTIIIHDAKVILIADFPILAFWLTVAAMLPAATLNQNASTVMVTGTGHFGDRLE